jgi:hypothetical protein
VKIIDEKGALFGKINIIDFMVLLFLLLLAPMFFYGYKIFSGKPTVKAGQVSVIKEGEFADVELAFIFRRVKPDILGLIAVGDKAVGEDREITAEILSLGEAKPYSHEINIGSSKKTIVDPAFRDLPVILRIKAEIRQNILHYGGKLIADNADIDFTTDKYRLEATYSPNLIVNDNSVLNTLDSIKTIQMKQKELEHEISKLRNKVNSLESKMDSSISGLNEK